MSRVAYAREPVVVDLKGIRRPMTEARKRRIHTARGGLCRCGVAVPMFGKGVTYDHDPPLWFTMEDRDEDVWPICDECDDAKTPGDISRVAETKRQQQLSLDVPKEPSKHRWPSRSMETRPFPKDNRANKWGYRP